MSFINNNLDILAISDTKNDDTFPDSQFLINDFTLPYRLDRRAKGGEILLYIREYIPSKRINKSHSTSHLKGFL